MVADVCKLRNDGKENRYDMLQTLLDAKKKGNGMLSFTDKSDLSKKSPNSTISVKTLTKAHQI